MEADSFLVKFSLYSPSSCSVNKELNLRTLPAWKSKNIDAPLKVRHCAYCLKILCGSIPIKLCTKCKRRSYCSKSCQLLDWSIKENGQRHENWCGRYDYGEEDIDWEVIPVPKKGLGIRAKRFLPSGFRIIVEPVFTSPHDHPGIADLEPKGALLEDKFKLNSIMGDEDRDNGQAMVGLRMSRVNHSCRPNASRAYDEAARVNILFALKDIPKDEEICVSYCNFARIDPERPTAGMSPQENEFDAVQESLKFNWGITCPDDCYCKDPTARKLVLEGRKLDFLMENWAVIGETEASLMAGEKLLHILRELNISWIHQAAIEFDLFRIALMKRKTVPKACKYIRAVVHVYRIITPFSKYTKNYDKLMEEPKEDGHYLMMDMY